MLTPIVAFDITQKMIQGRKLDRDESFKSKLYSADELRMFYEFYTSSVEIDALAEDLINDIDEVSREEIVEKLEIIQREAQKIWQR